MGFFTDTSVCIGCKACEVACKEWNLIPEDGLDWTGESLRQHVAARRRTRGATSPSSSSASRCCSAPRRVDDGDGADGGALRWLMRSDVCKHCTHAGCLDVCPTGVALPHRVRHGRRAGGHLQRLRLLRPRVPVRRARPARPAALRPVARRCRSSARRRTAASGSARSATTGSRAATSRRARRRARPTRSSSASSTSCASGPTGGSRSSRPRAGTARGSTAATRTTASAASAPSSCCSTSPRSTGCRPTRSCTTEHLPGCGGRPRSPAAALVAATAAAFFGGRGDAAERATRSITEVGTPMDSYYGRPIVKEPVWKPEIPLYFFTGGLAGASAVLHGVARAGRQPRLARAAATGGAVAGHRLAAAARSPTSAGPSAS